MKLHMISASFSAGLIGFVAWQGYANALLLLPLLAWIWSQCKSRQAAFAALFCYYATASRSMPSGAAMFYASVQPLTAWWIAGALWLAASALLASVWALAWGRHWRAARLVFIMLLITLPPIGVIGWANPLTAAGMFFPGLAWAGLVALLLLLCILVTTPRPAFLAPFLLISALAHAQTPMPSLASSGVPMWYPINTQLGDSKNLASEFQHLTSLQNSVKQILTIAPAGAFIVLPEMVAGDWSINSPWWDDLRYRLKKKQQTVLLGAHWPAPSLTKDGRYINGMVTLGANDGITMQERLPVPFAMWRPWTNDGAVATWFAPGTTTIGGKKIGHLICYEQILTWPVLTTFAGSPDILIAISNLWWANNTSIAAIQRQAIEAWTKLFAVDVVRATNT